MYILTEGVTELTYFKALILKYACENINVQQGRSSDPLRLACEAIAQRNEIVANQQVWIVLDKEIANKDRTRQRRLQKAQRLSKRHNIQIAISQPCFEGWLNSHLGPMKDYRINQTSKHFGNILTQKLNYPYNKNSYNADSFMGEVAISNALKSPVGQMGLSRLVICLMSRANSKNGNSLIAHSVNCLDSSKQLDAADYAGDAPIKKYPATRLGKDAHR